MLTPADEEQIIADATLAAEVERGLLPQAPVTPYGINTVWPASLPERVAALEVESHRRYSSDPKDLSPEGRALLGVSARLRDLEAKAAEQEGLIAALLRRLEKAESRALLDAPFDAAKRRQEW